MPQPAITGVPPILQFGGQALPNGQGTQAYINLNDTVTWRWMGWPSGVDSDYYLHTIGRYVWRARGTFLGQDTGSRKISLPFWYNEAATKLGASLAQLSQAGQQFLTFDNLTGIPVKLAGAKSRRIRVAYSPYQWNLDLEFIAPTPWFQDLSATTLTTVNVVNAPTAAPSGAVAAGGALATGTYTLQYTFVTASGETAASPASSNIVLTTGNQQISVSAVTPLPAFATAVKWYFAAGSPTTGFTVQNNGAAFTLNTAGNAVAPPTTTPATAFSVAYAGSVWAEPVWTLTIPSTNAGVITTATLTNTLSGEQLIAQLGGLAASTAYTITMDTRAMTIVDGSSKAYDNTGNSFPLLYGPAGQSNAFTLAIAVSSGLFSGLTFGGSWNPLWEI